ncbi:MAG: IPTL-CTERM sorting domain-containing protein, partial [Candidatus Dadabacteria bacterium]|nr:IPTL-CTERM sorting domain-containing protein [Candidatus Dadabacteria bacterium]
ISIFVSTFLIVGFLFLALPEKGISSVLHGCCIVDSECLGCESGCATSEGFCTEAGSTSVEGICFNDGGGAICDDSSDLESEVGCCTIGPRNCEEDLGWRDCVGDSPVVDGEIWTPGVACSEVPLCTATPAVPTLSEWGLIAMAGVLGIVGIIGFLVIRRRKVTA